MTLFGRYRLAVALALGALLSLATDSNACQVRALVDALSQAGPGPARPPSSLRPVQAAAVSAAELAAIPALASAESLLRSVGLPLAWHWMDRDMIEAGLEAGGGTLIVAEPKAGGGEVECRVLTPESAATLLAQATQAPVMALLPVGQAQSSGGGFVVRDRVRDILADFRLAMRVGTQYAPQGAWVISPWLTEVSLRRDSQVQTPLPGVQARSDTRLRTTGAGVGLTRGLSGDTSLTLVLAHQYSRGQTTIDFPDSLPLPAQRIDVRQEDSLLGFGLYSRLTRQDGLQPNLLFQGRAFTPSRHSRANGSAALTPLYELANGWSVSATMGTEAERPEAAPSRFVRLMTLGAGAQLSSRWMVTVDAGWRQVRGFSGTQSVERLRLYHSFASMSYLVLVIDREGQDRRATVTFARPL